MLTIWFRGIGLEHGKNQGPEEGRDLSYHAVGIDRAVLLHDLEHVGGRECHLAGDQLERTTPNTKTSLANVAGSLAARCLPAVRLE